MSQISYTYTRQTKPGANYLKSMVLVFGVFLSLLTFTSFDSLENSTDTAVDDKTEKSIVSNANTDLTSVEQLNASGTEMKQKTHHNFIASYLLQESTFNKKTEQRKEQSNFFTNLKQLHKIIIVQMLGAI